MGRTIKNEKGWGNNPSKKKKKKNKHPIPKNIKNFEKSWDTEEYLEEDEYTETFERFHSKNRH